MMIDDDDDHNLVVAALGRRSILVITSSIGTGPHSFSTLKAVDDHPSSYITFLFSVFINRNHLLFPLLDMEEGCSVGG